MHSFSLPIKLRDPNDIFGWESTLHCIDCLLCILSWMQAT